MGDENQTLSGWGWEQRGRERLSVLCLAQLRAHSPGRRVRQLRAVPGPSLNKRPSPGSGPHFAEAHPAPSSASAPEGSPAGNQLCSQPQGLVGALKYPPSRTPQDLYPFGKEDSHPALPFLHLLLSWGVDCPSRLLTLNI